MLAFGLIDLLNRLKELTLFVFVLVETCTVKSFTTQSPRQAVSDPTYGATDNREGQNQRFSMRPSEFLDGLEV